MKVFVAKMKIKRVLVWCWLLLGCLIASNAFAAETKVYRIYARSPWGVFAWSQGHSFGSKAYTTNRWPDGWYHVDYWTWSDDPASPGAAQPFKSTFGFQVVNGSYQGGGPALGYIWNARSHFVQVEKIIYRVVDGVRRPVGKADGLFQMIGKWIITTSPDAPPMLQADMLTELTYSGDDCESCETGDCTPNVKTSNGSVEVRLPLGRGREGFGRTELVLHTDTVSLESIRRGSLRADQGFGAEVINLSGQLNQVLGSLALAVVDTTSEPNVMAFKLYAIADKGTKDGTGNYVPTGAPFKTVKLKYSTPAGEKRLDVTETIDGNENVVSTFSADDASGLLTHTRTGAAYTETNNVSWSPDFRTKTVINEHRTSDGQLIYKERKIYESRKQGMQIASFVRDPDGAAVTESFEYHSDTDTQVHLRGRLHRHIDEKGHWRVYEYDSTGRVSKVVSQLGSNPVGSQESENRVVTTVHSPAAQGIPALTTVEEREANVVVAKRIQAFPTAWETHDIECLSPSATWDSGDRLITITKRYSSGPFAERVRSILRPDGTATFYEYAAGTQPGDIVTTTWTGGPAVYDSGGNIVGVTNGRKIEVRDDSRGMEAERTEWDVQGGVAATVVDARVRGDEDVFGRPKRWDYTDGTTEAFEYACCGVSWSKSRQGVETFFGYDEARRQVAQGELIPGPNDSTTLLEQVRLLDPAGRVREERRKASSVQGQQISDVLVRSYQYDLAGRLTAISDLPVNNGATRRVTSVSEGAQAIGGTNYWVRTESVPGEPDRGPSVVQEISFLDGRLHKLLGSASQPARFEYDVATITQGTQSLICRTQKQIKLDEAGEDTAEWSAEYFDLAGRLRRKESPREAAIGGTAAYDSVYNTAGQLEREIDADGVVTLYGYNAEGEREVVCIDVNRNGVIDYAGTGTGSLQVPSGDRITRTSDSISMRGQDVVYRTTTEQWQTDGSGQAITAAIMDQTPSGLKRWSTQFGLTSASTSTVANGKRTNVDTFPDGSTQTTTTMGSRTLSQERVADGQVILGQSFAYDSMGRVGSVLDARSGTTYYTYYSDDRIATVTTPQPDPATPAQVTSFEYDVNGQKKTETLPDNAVVNYTYWPTGTLKRQWGARTYPVEYAYDAHGRLKTLKTWQEFANDAGASVTTWNYDVASGRLIRKLYNDNKGPAYTYTTGGRLGTRTWQRGVVTTYGYNNAGDLSSIDYSDDTPDVGFVRDRAGRAGTVTDAAGTRTLQYTPDGRLELETFDAGLFQGFSIDPHYDALARRDSLTTNWTGSQGAQSFSTGYGYDGASRLKTVSRDNATATYTHETAGGNLVRKIEVSRDGQLVLQTDSPHDKLGRLTSIASTWVPTSTVVSGYSYRYNAANQRERADVNNGTHWSYGYDALGQVTSGKRFWSASNTEVAGQQYGYTYDDIGNRKTATTNGRTSTYASTLLNQYSNRTVPGAVDVIGEAAPDATVTVNNERATRQGAYFHKAASTPNTSQTYSGGVKVTAVKNNSGPQGEDSISEELRPVIVPQNPESFTYDDDGNLESDGQWQYTWDGENRLVGMETHPNLLLEDTKTKIIFQYDCIHRRIVKEVQTWDEAAGSYLPKSKIGFSYNGWKLVSEHDLLSAASLVRAYTWGLDLSGSEGGAGGSGGLLFSFVQGENGTLDLSYTYDGNGNVASVVQLADGTREGVYEYDPSGRTIRSSGLIGSNNPFRFATKYEDVESGLLYYGYRYFNPAQGRWLVRDPIGEAGGVSLFSNCGNNLIDYVDLLGLSRAKSGSTLGFMPGFFTDRGCGDFILDTYWLLTPASGAGGYIVQRIEVEAYVQDCEGKVLIQRSKRYREAWHVAPAERWGFVLRNEIEAGGRDTWDSGVDHGCTRGYVRFTAVAEFLYCCRRVP